MLIRSFLRFIEERRLFSADDYILLAVSGGVDSTVMAHLFHHAKFRFAIAHCHFGLRGGESDLDAEFVQNLAVKLDVPFFLEKFDTAAIASERGISIQMAARDLRYEWFEKIRIENQFDYVAVAHHLDDQVETFMINLIRGTGIAGLHGIPVKNGSVIRPLMFTFRQNIDDYADQHQVIFRTDRSNNQTKYLRNKIRHEVLPLLVSINPEFTHGLTASINRISEFEQVGNHALSKWCESVQRIDNSEIVIDIQSVLENAPAEPYAWALLSPYGFSQTQVSNILGCIQTADTRIFNSATHTLIKNRNELIISLAGPRIEEKSVKIALFANKKRITKPIMLTFERIRDVENYVIPATGDIASIDFSKLQFPLTIRRWRHGDFFFPLGMKRKKKLSDFFIDQKLSLNEKENTWLLCSGNDIAWIINRRIDHRFRVTVATSEILRITTPDM
jgi:tRNA(Ile)-lysidine synthase